MELPYRAALRWVQIFKKENQEQTPEPYELIEITPSTEPKTTARMDSTPRNDSGIRIQVNGITIELDRGFDCETLKSVLEITRSVDA
jgi:hypothetical protein